MRQLSAVAERFALARPFAIARGVKTHADVVTVTLREGGTVGRGEGVPYGRYGETSESALAEIEAVRHALEAGAGRANLLTLMRAGAARNAVDCALWDLESALTGKTVSEMIGLSLPDRVPSALTIGIDTPEAMAEAAATLADAPLIKVKLGGEDPMGRLAAVRAAAPEPALIVDPNEGWTAAMLADFAADLARHRVTLLEQPLPAGDDDGLKHHSGVPVAADESFHGAGDLDRVAALYGVVNIKLDKTGGLTASLELVEAAKVRGLAVMVGCMVCSSLSVAPALHLARHARFVDLDGPVWLSQDRAHGFAFDNGWINTGSRAQPIWGGL
jgi:L-Ala-D/L-Glu epimerase